ncbi:hypothetical protein BGC_16760 [Burkholderia sp. 3C]
MNPCREGGRAGRRRSVDREYCKRWRDRPSVNDGNRLIEPVYRTDKNVDPAVQQTPLYNARLVPIYGIVPGARIAQPARMPSSPFAASSARSAAFYGSCTCPRPNTRKS